MENCIVLFLKVAVFILVAFTSYAVGRWSHIVGGHLNTPHHWIYGIVAIIVGAVFYKHLYGWFLISIGIGMVVSDFKDMINLKFFGPDEVEKLKFWGFD